MTHYEIIQKILLDQNIEYRKRSAEEFDDKSIGENEIVIDINYCDYVIILSFDEKEKLMSIRLLASPNI